MNLELLLKVAIAVFGILAGVLGLVGKLTGDRKKGFFRRLTRRGVIAFALTVGVGLGGITQLVIDEYSSSTRENITERNHAQTIDAVAKARLDIRELRSDVSRRLEQIEASLTSLPTPSPSVTATPKA